MVFKSPVMTNPEGPYLNGDFLQESGVLASILHYPFVVQNLGYHSWVYKIWVDFGCCDRKHFEIKRQKVSTSILIQFLSYVEGFIAIELQSCINFALFFNDGVPETSAVVSRFAMQSIFFLRQITNCNLFWLV